MRDEEFLEPAFEPCGVLMAVVVIVGMVVVGAMAMILTVMVSAAGSGAGMRMGMHVRFVVLCRPAHAPASA